MLGEDMLRAVTQHTGSRSARISSWDHSGLNEDAFVVQPGETAILADLEGPGTITHLWFVQTCRRILGPGLIPYSKSGVAMLEVENGQGVNYEVMDPDYYRKVLIKMYWDDSGEPNVLAPLGDFFCVGHSIASNFQSLPFTASVKPNQDKKFGGAAALNCYLQMPFNKRARIVVENQNDVAYFQYFYIDYELQTEPHPASTLFFHASWNRSNPTPGWAPPDLQTNSLETMVPNLDGRNNYVILETKGSGVYVGCNHSVYHFQGTWWGEGDDMIFIDDDAWPPSMHGTGGEDYFSQGWGMQKNAFPFAGSIIHEKEMPPYQVSYRWHLADPVRFNSRIKVTMEYGHANHLSDDWSSTAYWYQTLPGPRLTIANVSERLPRRASAELPEKVGSNEAALDDRRKEMVKQRQKRLDAFKADKMVWLERRAEDSRERAKKNIEHAADPNSRASVNIGGELTHIRTLLDRLERTVAGENITKSPVDTRRNRGVEESPNQHSFAHDAPSPRNFDWKFPYMKVQTSIFTERAGLGGDYGKRLVQSERERPLDAAVTTPILMLQRQDIVAALQSFSDKVHPWYPFLEGAFAECVSRCVSHSFSRSTDSFLVLMVLASGALTQVASHAQALQERPDMTYLNAALQMMHLVMLEKGLRSVQCLAAASIHYCLLMRPLQAHDLAVLAIKKAQDLYLCDAFGSDQIARELWTRVYRVALLIEGELVIPIKVSETTAWDNDEDIPLPAGTDIWSIENDSGTTPELSSPTSIGSPQPDQLATYLLAEVAMRRMLRRNTTAIKLLPDGTVEYAPRIAQELEDQVQHWYSFLPDSLRFPTANSSSLTDTLNQSVFLRTQYWAYLVSIAWPAVVKVMNSDGSSEETRHKARAYFHAYEEFVTSATEALTICLPNKWTIYASIFAISMGAYLGAVHPRLAPLTTDKTSVALRTARDAFASKKLSHRFHARFRQSPRKPTEYGLDLSAMGVKRRNCLHAELRCSFRNADPAAGDLQDLRAVIGTPSSSQAFVRPFSRNVLSIRHGDCYEPWKSKQSTVIKPPSGRNASSAKQVKPVVAFSPGRSSDMALSLVVALSASILPSWAAVLKRETRPTSSLVEPNSTFFSTANVAYSATLNIAASDGDLWPTTWADDGSLYTANGDGRGFSSNQADFSDIVVNRIDGTPELGITGVRLAAGNSVGRIWSSHNYNRKPTGIIAVDGDGDGHDELYLAVQDLNNGTAGPGGGPTGDAFNEVPAATIVKSTDYGLTWSSTDAAMFTNHVFTTVFFLDYGQSNSHATILGESGSKYVYAYGLDNNWRDSVNNAVPDPQDLYLARVPISSIQDISTWEFFCGSASEPAWAADIGKRASVLHDDRREYPGGTTIDGFSVISQGSVVYNAPLNRYIYSSWSDYSFEFYESPQPWGPFTLFHHKDFGVTPWFGTNTSTPKNGGYATTIPSKFISADGLSMWVQSNWFVGAAEGSNNNYCFSLRPLKVTPYKPSQPDNEPDNNSNLATTAGTVPIDKASHYGQLKYLNDGKLDSEDSWDGSIKDFDRWGYTWPTEFNLNRLVLTTGSAFPDGGYFEAGLKVQIRKDFEWLDAVDLKIDPDYPYDSTANPRQTYILDFDVAAADGVQLIGRPVGNGSFTSVSELQVYYVV